MILRLPGRRDLASSVVAVPRPKTPPMPIVSRRPDPTVWAEAVRMVDGDHRLLTVLPDGTVHVANRPR